MTRLNFAKEAQSHEIRSRCMNQAHQVVRGLENTLTEVAKEIPITPQVKVLVDALYAELFNSAVAEAERRVMEAMQNDEEFAPSQITAARRIESQLEPSKTTIPEAEAAPSVAS